jgi:signal peptidase II
MPTKNRSTLLAWTAWSIIIAVIAADQVLKVWIKTHFYINEDYEITSWFHLHFVQNNGMAFGLDFLNKHVLTFLRLGLFGFLVWYIRQLCRRAWLPMGYMVSIALIAAGAFGNIIDCVCYGEIFTNPYPPMTAEFVPWGDGYGGIFQGLVVDMLYFPLFSFTWPAWLPVIGGKVFSFFDPVFNIADVAISVGMISIVLFYFNMMEHSLEDEKPRKDTAD